MSLKDLSFKRANVSDVDLKSMNQSMGELDFLGNPQKSQIMVDNLYKYFGTQKSKLAIPLEQMQDRYYYRNDQEFDKVQEILNNPVNGLKRSFTPTGESSAPAIGTLDLTKTG
jgi:outer membrane receptor for ferric coprogen and ferric-rhodotorulic acid